MKPFVALVLAALLSFGTAPAGVGSQSGSAPLEGVPAEACELGSCDGLSGSACCCFAAPANGGERAPLAPLPLRENRTAVPELVWHEAPR